jgi:hypothetical protein
LGLVYFVSLCEKKNNLKRVWWGSVYPVAQCDGIFLFLIKEYIISYKET